MSHYFENYANKLISVLQHRDWNDVSILAASLSEALETGRNIFLCGNGGSAANAMHIANDLLCGMSMYAGKGFRAHALSSNQAITTCLANDCGYEHIYSHQLEVLANEGDLCVVFSGSGNSPNILKALQKAKEKKLKSFAVLGYSGGKALQLADISIHFPIDDMQIAEDCQLIVGHMLMQNLVQKKSYLSNKDRENQPLLSI